MKKTITPLYLHRRKDLTKDDLLEIYHSLNQFIWDDRLGEMPQEYHASRADEYRISCAVMMEIEWLVSKREPRGLSPSGGNSVASSHVPRLPCAHSAQSGVQGFSPARECGSRRWACASRHEDSD